MIVFFENFLNSNPVFACEEPLKDDGQDLEC